MLNRKQAKALSTRLDKIANHVQSHFNEMGLSKKEAYDFCLYLDKTSDVLEHKATTLKRDEDEDYMDSFNAPDGVHERDEDEDFMDTFDDNNDDQIATDDALAPLHDGDWSVESYDADDNWYTACDEEGDIFEEEDDLFEEGDNWYTASEDEDDLPEEEAVEASWY